MTLPRTVILALGAALMSGCATAPPIEYYTLAPVNGDHAHTPVAPVQIAAVHIPAALDRQPLVRGLSPTHLELEESAHWIAPLDALMLNALTQDLQSRLGASAVLAATASAPDDARRIVIDVLSFAPTANGNVVFDGSWTSLHHAQPAKTHPLHISVPTPTDNADGQAQAMSAILGKIADRIASVMAP